MRRFRSKSPALALGILTAIGTIGFVDRIVVNALVEPLKAEFGLSDAQIGLLGFAYAALNITLGVVIARLAESRRRLTFTAIGTFLWSLAATASGLVANWPQLLAARIAVGVGEAVGLPANQSVVADYFPPKRRASAMSILLLAPRLVPSSAWRAADTSRKYGAGAGRSSRPEYPAFCSPWWFGCSCPNPHAGRTMPTPTIPCRLR